MMSEITRRLFRSQLIAITVASVFILSATAAWADDISYVSTFRNISYEQTGDGNTLSLNGTFFSADIFATAPNAYTSASVTTPGGALIPLTQAVPGDYGFQTSTISKADMDTLYPTGTYTFMGNTAGPSDTATLDYSADDYSQTNPYLTGNTYSSLQGLNAAQNFTFNLSAFTPGGAANESDAFIFLTIYDYTTNTTVFSPGFLSPTTSSIFLPADTLQAGHSYDYELDFSDRDTGTGSVEQFRPLLGFDVRTDGTFTTAAAPAVPEPGSFLLLGTGLISAAGCALRRRNIQKCKR